MTDPTNLPPGDESDARHGADGSGEPTGADDVGSVGEEAAKLLGALTDWAREHPMTDAAARTADQAAGQGFAHLAGQAAQAAGSIGEQINEHLATGAAECTYCPICRTVHVIRETSPEVRAHLATAASSFLQAMAGLVAQLPPPNNGTTPRQPDLEHIDLEDDFGDDAADPPTGAR